MAAGYPGSSSLYLADQQLSQMAAANTDGGRSAVANYYVPSSAWTGPLSDIPRINIPPPPVDFSQESAEVKFSHPTTVEYESNQFGSPVFLRSLVGDGAVTVTQRISEWRYTERREYQPILPFLFVGPLSVTKDLDSLRATGFTLLISIRSGLQRCMDADKVADKLGIQSLNVDINGPNSLNREFPRAIKFLNDHLETGTDARTIASSSTYAGSGKVLVYCETGNDKSAAFAAAYMMAVYGFDMIGAVQFVQSQRFSTAISEGVKHALDTFGALLAAIMDVSRANRVTAATSNDLHRPSASENDGSAVPVRSKRTMDSEDVGVLACEGMLGMGMEKRMMEAPFRDQQG